MAENTKYVDLLDEDKAIAGQKFVCLSFLSPEKILKQKDLYFFNEFIKQWDFSKSMEKTTQFLSFLAYKYNFRWQVKRSLYIFKLHLLDVGNRIKFVTTGLKKEWVVRISVLFHNESVYT